MSHNLPYLLFFIPLLFAMFNNFFYNEKASYYLFVGGIASMLLLSVGLIPAVAQNDFIASDIGIRGASLLTEYKLDLLNIIFLILVLFVNFNKGMFYRRNYMGLSQKGTGRFFYLVNFLNVFAMMGMLLTNNVINLFIFAEIYGFTFYALNSDATSYLTSTMAFRYFRNGIVGSFFLMLSCIMLYVLFGTGNMDVISQNMHFVTEQSGYVTSLILSAFLIGIFFKHFAIWLYITKVKRNSKMANLLTISALFTKMTLGIYLLLRALFVIFERNVSFNIAHADKALATMGLILMVYSFTKTWKRKNLKLTSIFFTVISFAMMLLGISLGSELGIKSVLVYIINYNTAVLGFFLITSLFLYTSGHVDYRLLDKINKSNAFIFVPFVIIIAPVLCIPFTLGFFGDWYLFWGALEKMTLISMLMIVALFMKWSLCVNFIMKFTGQLFSNKVNEQESYEDLSNRPDDFDHTQIKGDGELLDLTRVHSLHFVSLGLVCAIIIISTLLSFTILNSVDYVAEYLIANPVTGMRVQ